MTAEPRRATADGTPEDPPEPNSLYPVDVVVQVMGAEELVLSELIESGGDRAERPIAQGLIVVQRVITQDISSSVTLRIDSVGVEVVVPLEALEQNGLEEAFLVATAIDEAWSAATGSDGKNDRKPIDVFSALNLRIHNATGFEQTVQNLSEPIAFALPVNKALGVDCAFWDLELNDWSLAGFVNGGDQLQEEHLVCYTPHLTFFGAVIEGIVEGVVEAFECSHVTLLSAEGFQELGSDDWYLQMPAFLLWLSLIGLVVLLTSAACVDLSRENVGLWDDTHFLIVDGEAASQPALVDQETGHAAATTPRSSAGAEAGNCDCECGRAFARPTVFMWECSKDAVDDLMENWMFGFGQLRTMLDSLVQSLSAHSAKGGPIMSVLTTCMTAAMVRNAQLQACAELRVAHADVRLVMGNNDALKAIRLETEAAATASSAGSAGIHVLIVGLEGDRAERRARKLTQLRNAASQQVERRLQGHSDWNSLLGMSSALFTMHQPLGGVLVPSIFISSSLRVLLLACKTIGSLLIITIFFEGTGDRTDCDGPEGVGEHIGRLIAIAVVSTLLSVLPVACLGCLHWRRFKHVPGEGSEQWVRQLRAWRNQDRLIWVLGSIYVSFGVLFICLFLANMDASSLTHWTIAAAVSILQDALVLPLILALVGPLFAIATLALVSYCQSTLKGSAIRDAATSCGLANFTDCSMPPPSARQEPEEPGHSGPPPAATLAVSMDKSSKLEGAVECSVPPPPSAREEPEAPGLSGPPPTDTLVGSAQCSSEAESGRYTKPVRSGRRPSSGGDRVTLGPPAPLPSPKGSSAGSGRSPRLVEFEEFEVVFRQAEGFPEVRVFLDHGRASRVVGDVPNGERGICLAEFGEFVRIRWYQMEGWVGRKNVVPVGG